MNRIYYFSGTGNTLAAAKKIAALLGDTELIAIADLQRSEEVEFKDADTIGIFHPVYCFGVPTLVLKFLERIKKPEGVQPYVFIIIPSSGTCFSMEYIPSSCLKTSSSDTARVSLYSLPYLSTAS